METSALFESFVAAAREQFADDRDTIGELAAAVNRQSETLAEVESDRLLTMQAVANLAVDLAALRDELHAHITRETERSAALLRVVNSRTDHLA